MLCASQKQVLSRSMFLNVIEGQKVEILLSSDFLVILYSQRDMSFYILYLYIQGWKVWTCLHDATPARLLRLAGEAPEVCGCHDHQLLQGGRHHFLTKWYFMNNPAADCREAKSVGPQGG